jgi:copper transport protein
MITALRKLQYTLVLVLLVSLFAGPLAPTSAHGYILRSIPENRVTLERPPVRLQYWFSEGLEPSFSKLILRDQSGNVLAEGQVDERDTSLMVLQVPPELPDGAYIVELRPAFASDGHVTVESRVFFVGEEVGGVSGESEAYVVQPLEVVWRVALQSSMLVLFGAFALYNQVLIPAWGNEKYRAGLLPPRVMNRMNWIVWGAMIVLLAANVLALLQQSMVFFNTGLSEVITQNLWALVRIGSRFGDFWNIRMMLLVLMAGLHGASLYFRDRAPEAVRAFWSANMWAGILLLATNSVTAHAAGALLWPWGAVIADWLHLFTAGLWLGGLAALVLVMPVALKPYDTATRQQALHAVLRRFSPIAVASLVVVTATGIYSSLTWLYSPADIVQTPWGGALVIKTLLVGSVFLLGAVHHISANAERFERWHTRLSGVMNLGLSLRLEVLMALLIMGAVAMLAATPVPEPDFLGAEVNTPTESQSIGALDVHMAISPGGPGVNTFDIIAEYEGERLEAEQVMMQVVDPAADWHGGWQQAEPIDPGLYVTAGDQISKEGRWLTLVDLKLPEGETQRVVFDWDISLDSAVPTSREPVILHFVAIAGVVAAVFYMALPSLRRLYRWLNWTPSSVAIGLISTGATAVAIYWGAVMIQNNIATYEANLNPPPAVVNAVLPDGESLLQGAVIITEHCTGWENSADLQVLLNRLERTRDEEIFQLTGRGWRGLPACTRDLTETDRWHVVNYIRSLGAY